ncbi:MAG TPA: DUF523 and DUF1722 domain-containing protein [Rectinemataceae bacterium]
MEPIKLGVSACLLGRNVRYDGGHKRDAYIVETLGNFFSFVPVCPEVEFGLPIPRESMRLVGDPEAPRLVTTRSGKDLTEGMLAFCEKRAEALTGEKLRGFIFKKDSPSSGLFRVKVYADGVPGRPGRGLFAAAVARRFPLLPLEEEGRLNDPALRENFIERVFAYARLGEFLEGDPGPGGLVEFHTAHKLLVMSHSVALYRELGALVAGAGVRGADWKAILGRYKELFMKALALQATEKKNVNVLMHIMGYFKGVLSADEKAELLEIIGQYKNRLVPLVVPLTLVKHYIRKYGEPYLAKQFYLSPHPAELMLRNRV